MNWRLIAIPVTLVPILAIALQFEIGIDDVLAVGLWPFVGAIIAVMAKLALQGIKFAYIARSYIGNSFDSIKKLVGVRMGSEFIKFTTPMFVGAELVVIYYLHKKNVKTSQATWVAILDIVTEVLAAGTLSVIAGIIALVNGAYVVAAVVLGTSIPITALWVTLFFLSSKRTFQTPIVIKKLLIKIGKKKAAKIVEDANVWMNDICYMSRNNMHTTKAKKVFLVSLTASMVSWILYGISFFIITLGTGYVLGAFDSVMAVMGANAIGNLPITVGGSGLAEFGIVAFLTNADIFNLDITGHSDIWKSVIGWRVATYYVPIAITWFLLVKLALSKYKNKANVGTVNSAPK
ncbi:MAG: Membrane protein [Cenarchaeum symbiont of Oopsacas minuta]|nr:Membrane protein [Cenarchaeum symbiont of Oopsacas minuta]